MRPISIFARRPRPSRQPLRGDVPSTLTGATGVHRDSYVGSGENVVRPSHQGRTTKVRYNCAAVDKSRQEKIAAGITTPTAEPVEEREKPGEETSSGIGYRVDDINPNDIPL